MTAVGDASLPYEPAAPGSMGSSRVSIPTPSPPTTLARPGVGSSSSLGLSAIGGSSSIASSNPTSQPPHSLPANASPADKAAAERERQRQREQERRRREAVSFF